jgi:hypothetical protein
LSLQSISARHPLVEIRALEPPDVPDDLAQEGVAQ